MREAYFHSYKPGRLTLRRRISLTGNGPQPIFSQPYWPKQAPCSGTYVPRRGSRPPLFPPLRRSTTLRLTRALLYAALFGIAVLPVSVYAQFGAVYPSERIQAGQRINAFVSWEGVWALEGLSMDLPAGWRLVEASAVRRGSNTRVPLRLRESSMVAGRHLAYAMQTIRGPHLLILEVEVGPAVGSASIDIMPMRRRADGRLMLTNSRKATWAVVVAEAATSRGGKAFRRGNVDELYVLDRRALPGLDAQSAYTMEAWIKTTGLEEVVLSTWNGRDEQVYPLEWLVDARGRLVVYRGEPGEHVGMRTSNPVADGRWHHVAVSQNPSNGRVRLFVDGNVVDSLRTSSSGAANNTLSLTVGGRRAASGGSRVKEFSGYIDELRFWGRARSRDEIRFTMRQQITNPVEGLLRLGFDTEPSPSILRELPRGDLLARSDLSFSYPVEALSAEVDGAIVHLMWETKDRQNNRFSVERSSDGRSYHSIGSVLLRDRIAEAANGTMRFSFTDVPPEGPLHYYRIRQHFPDAPERVSAALKLGLGDDGAQLAVIEGNSPNPFSGITTINFTLQQTSTVRLSVWDVSGGRVAVLVDNPLRAGRHSVRFDAGDLPSGIYFVQLQTPEMRLTHKLTLTR